MNYVDQAAPRRKTVRIADRTGLSVPSVASSPIDVAQQLTLGGRLVHRRTHRCAAFCNTVADLAGIGPQEAR